MHVIGSLICNQNDKLHHNDDPIFTMIYIVYRMLWFLCVWIAFFLLLIGRVTNYIIQMHSSSMSGSNCLVRLQNWKKVVGWCTAQWKMLLFDDLCACFVISIRYSYMQKKKMLLL